MHCNEERGDGSPEEVASYANCATTECWIAAGLLLACAFSPAGIFAQDAADTPAAAPQQTPVMEADASAHFLESGYRHLYELNFVEARADFTSYQNARPDDPLGKASEAASYLFEQFNAKRRAHVGIFSE